MSFPNKEVRQKCYQSRDAYWECLDKQEANNNSSQCNEFRNQFEKLCPSQWVPHFDRKREYLKFKERMEKDGYEPVSTQGDN